MPEYYSDKAVVAMIKEKKKLKKRKVCWMKTGHKS